MDQKVTRRLGSVLQRGRWIVAGTFVSMFFTFIISHALPKIYPATTYILVSEARGSNATAMGWDFTLIPTYVPLVDNDAIIANALQHFHLDQAPFHLTLHRFRQKGYVDVRLPKSSRLIEIDVRFPNARLAADIANYLAQSAVSANDQANEAETAVTQKALKRRLDQVSARLSETETSRVALQKRAQIENKEKQLEILLDEKAQVTKQIESLQLTLPQDDPALRSLQDPPGTEPGTSYLEKKPSTKRLDAPNPNTPPETGGASNAANEQPRRKLADSGARLEGDREGLKAARSRLLQIGRQIDDLFNETTQLRNDLERSDQDFQLASEAYESASRDYGDAPVSVAARSVTMRQITSALIPEQPVGPGALVNAVLAGALALVLLIGAIVGVESLREIRSRSADAIVQAESESVSARSS